MSFVFFCRIGTCRPCARGVCGAGLRLLNVRRAKILFSAVIFFLPAAIFRPPSAFPSAPNPLFPVSFAPFDPPAAFLSPFLSSRLFRPPPSSLPSFLSRPLASQLRSGPARCLPLSRLPLSRLPLSRLPLSRLPFPFRFPRDLVPAPSAVFLFPVPFFPFAPPAASLSPILSFPVCSPPLLFSLPSGPPPRPPPVRLPISLPSSLFPPSAFSLPPYRF